MKSIAKIWIIIVILAITFVSLIQWGTDAYQKSSVSIQDLSFSDNESYLTQEIFQSVIHSDLHLNNFIITGKEEQKILAQKFQTETDRLIMELKNGWMGDSSKTQQIDSLQHIISEKKRISNVLLNVKKRQYSQFFTEQALNQIKNQLSDSAFIEVATTQKENLIASIDTLEHTEIVKIPDQRKGFKGFFRKMFGKEIITYDTVTHQELIEDYEIQLVENSTITKNYFIDTTLLAVKDILVEILDEEILLQKNLRKTELSIISYNEQIIEKIRSLLEDISSNKESNIQERQENALIQIQEANRQAFFIAGLGILLGFILLIFLIKDIAQSNIYRKKLEQEKSRAEELANVKEVFLSNMGHEIKTPLHSIAGFTELLQKEIKDEKSHQLLKGISHAHQYLSQLINNILTQAKFNSKNFQPHHDIISIEELTLSISTIFEHHESRRDVVLEIKTADSIKDLSLETDVIQIQQVLINLIGNAFKFTKEGQIEVTLDRKGDQLLIEVLDTGIGIAPTELDKIFLPFQQAHKKTEVKMSGTGLGLSITKSIIDNLGGSIEVHSEVNKGTRFQIQLPVRFIEKTSIPSSVESKNSPLTYFEAKILAIEDDEWNRYILQQFLSLHVKDFIIFENAEDALEYFKVNHPSIDLILTDLNLPQMNGKDLFFVAQKIKKVPTILFSAGLSKEESERLKSLGISHAIKKPFKLEALLTSIESCLPQHVIVHSSENNQSNIESDIENILLPSIKNKLFDYKLAIQAKNIQKIGRLAHQLKSNLEQLGYSNWSESLQTIELFCDMHHTDRAIQLSERLLPEIENSI